MCNAPNAVMIFAAGLGSRMGQLTQDRPKPMIQVNGRPLIDHALALVDGHAVTRVVVNLHYKPQLLRDHLKDRDVLFADETEKVLETGGGLRAALPLLGSDPVFTLNSDAVWAGPNPMRLLQDAWRPDEMDALLMLVPKENALGHQGDGDFKLLSDGALERGPGLVYSGVQILKTDKLSEIEQDVFSLNVLWNQLLKDGRVHGVRYPGQWCDVGRPEGIALAESMLSHADV